VFLQQQLGNALYIDACEMWFVKTISLFYGNPDYVYEGVNVTLNKNNYYSPTGSLGEWDGRLATP
jgi:hypothetical protein